jgi:ADP-ribose pyrophosphatase YjhB (NUDIX family)
MHDKTHPWLEWARRIQAIAQTGLNHTEGRYDRMNYEELLKVAAEMVEHGSDLPAGESLPIFRVQPGYATVKVDVRGAVIRNGRILLVRERVDGRWTMPGGWADVGETPSQSVEREIREESGIEAKAERMIGVWDANREGRPMEFFHAFKVVFICRETGGELGVSEETTDVGFFDFDDLPELSSHRTGPGHLAEVRAHLADPDRPAHFD